ncbi:hypothetical protein VTK26DRAFT_4799 [Humicola hyalothermophila]
MATQWPPRSPHEALLSTPGGREKARRLAERASPSPSPAKLRASRSTSALDPRTGSHLTGDLEDVLFEGGEEDDDEDEETLQLKLQAIQARLKLKKLQAAKAQRKTAASPNPGHGDQGARAGLPMQSKLAAARDRMEAQNSIQVPASPIKRSQTAPDLQTSPKRVLLGIDKGLKAADVSLKRAPSQRNLNGASRAQQGGFLRRAKSPLVSEGHQDAPRPLSFNERLASARTEEIARLEKRERVQRLRNTAFDVGKQEMEDYKRKALDLPDLPSKAQEFSRDQILAAVGKSSGKPLQSGNTAPVRQPGGAGASDASPAPTASAGDADSGGAYEAYSGLFLSKRILPHRVLARAVTGKKTYLLKDLLRQVRAPDWCLPDDETDIVVFAIVASKSEPRSHKPVRGSDGKSQEDRGKYMVLTLVDLTYEVELFLFNSGFDRFWKLTPGTVLAILNPGILPPPPGREATNRFGLVINSDEDTILEIGNARDLGYCKSIKKDGTYCKSWVNAKRTEYCEFHTNEAVRKARSARIEMSSTAGFGGEGPRGRNKSRQFLTDEERKRGSGNYDRATQSQYFISTAYRATDPDDDRVMGMADRREREDALKRRLAQREKERDIARRLGELGGGAGKEYMSRAAARTTTAASSSFSSTATASFTSTSLPPSLNTSLTTLPSSSGEHSTPTPAPYAPRKLDAHALGLVRRGGADQPKINLGRAPPPSSSSSSSSSTTSSTSTAFNKRKRPESSQSSSTTVSGLGASTGPEAGPATTTTTTTPGGSKGAPLGWGSALKEKLGRMRDGEKFLDRGGLRLPPHRQQEPQQQQRNQQQQQGAQEGGVAGARGDKSPVRKKTRFVTEKGIREAGRESLGDLLLTGATRMEKLGGRQVVQLDDDDEDDLIIVR